MDLLNLLKDQMSDTVVDQISGQIRSDKTQTSAAVDGIFSTLVSALSRNAAKPEGASALLGAIDRDHDGSVLDDILGFVTAKHRPQQTKADNGLGIIDHVLGGNINNVIQMVSKSSGLDFLKTGQLMQMLAPMVMGALGKTRKQQNLDQGGITNLLMNTVKNASNQNKEMGLISKVLDADGDGKVLDDLAEMGMNVLSNLFKRR